MPWIMQMLGFGLLILGIAFALWVGIWVLLFLFALGIGMVVWSHLRSFLLAKGILNPTPGIPPDPADHPGVTIVEGDFKHLSSLAETDITTGD